MIMWCYLGFSFLLCAFSFQSSSILIIHSIHSDYWPSDEPTILGRIHILQCLWWIQHICDSLEHLNSHAKQHCHLGINCSWCLVFIADYFAFHAQHEDWSSGWQNKINKQIFGLFYCLFIYLFPSFPFFPSFSVNIVWLADSNSLLSNVVHACFICRMQRLWFIFITSSFHSIPCYDSFSPFTASIHHYSCDSFGSQNIKRNHDVVFSTWSVANIQESCFWIRSCCWLGIWNHGLFLLFYSSFILFSLSLSFFIFQVVLISLSNLIVPNIGGIPDFVPLLAISIIGMLVSAGIAAFTIYFNPCYKTWVNVFHVCLFHFFFIPLN